MKLTILSPVASTRHPDNAKSIEALAALFEDVSLCECYGFSEVARARNHVASLAYPEVKKKGGLVLWLDADMVINPDTVLLHAKIVNHTGKVISGRYVTRKDPGKVAASRVDPGFDFIDMYRGDNTSNHTVDNYHVKLDRVLSGMGCLMMPWEDFLRQVDNSPVSYRKENGKEIKEHIVCCPRIVADPAREDGYQMLSEDFIYCLSITRGVWMAAIEDPGVSFNYLDYGHITERTLLHANKPSTFRDDR